MDVHVEGGDDLFSVLLSQHIYWCNNQVVAKWVWPEEAPEAFKLEEEEPKYKIT